MPERPDLDYVVPLLAHELTGRRVVGQRVKKPVVLRILEEPRGAIRAVTRRAHAVVLDLDGRELVLSPMLAGRFTLVTPPAKDPADLAVAWALDDGRELRYRDDVQMGKVYFLAPGTPIPGLESVGVDVRSAAFTLDHFRALCRARRDQVKVFLMDKSALDALGNAYADEVLWSTTPDLSRRWRESRG